MENQPPQIGEIEPIDKPIVGEMEEIPQPEQTFMRGMKAGLTAQPGSGVGYFVGSALPAGIGGAVGGPIGAALGEAARQTAGAIVNPEDTVKKSGVGIGLQVAGAGAGQKVGEIAAPYISKAATAIGQKIASATDWLATKIGKSFLKGSKKLTAYGHSPEKALKDEGIIATSWDDLIDKVKVRLHDVGEQMDEVIGNAEKDTLTNVEDVVSPIDDALTEANKFPSENKTLIKRLNGLKSDVLGQLKRGSQEGRGLNVARANAIKKSLYKVTKYRGTDSDDIPLNIVKQDVARNLAQKIEDVTPEIGALNTRFGNLKALENAATNRAVVAERNNIVGIPEFAAVGAGLSATMVGGPLAGIATGLGTELSGRVIGTPTGATAAIKGLGALGKKATTAIPGMAETIAEKSGGAIGSTITQEMLRIKSDYKSGKISREEALKELREKHGLQ